MGGGGAGSSLPEVENCLVMDQVVRGWRQEGWAVIVQENKTVV